MKRRIFFFILTIIWMTIIFSFSAQPSEESDDISLSVGYTIGQMFVSDFDSWSLEEQEAFAERINHPVRKCAHATEYAVLGALLSGTILKLRKDATIDSIILANNSQNTVICQFLISFLIGVAYAASDEIHQLFVPGRAGRITDVLIDSGGIVIGLLLSAGVYVWKNKKKLDLNIL